MKYLFYRTALILSSLLFVTAAIGAESNRISVDFTVNEGDINPALFSLVNYPRFYGEADDESRKLLENLNIGGTQARIETMIHLLEPENDNDDPFVFDHERFRYEKMIRFIDHDPGLFIKDVENQGMEPLMLLTYNVPWLSADGRNNGVPTDNEEWAEFASAVVEYFNGNPEGPEYDPVVQWLEILNEPCGNGQFFNGTQEQYINLFSDVAERIHSYYPGVKVGGPSVLSGQMAFMIRFIKETAGTADFYTFHIYNEDPVLMVRKLETLAAYIRKTAGEGIPLFVTESDDWNLQGDDKWDFLIIRQMELLLSENPVESFHQFSLPLYRESAERVFGLLGPGGEVVHKNYWPYYWLRKARGEIVEVNFDGDSALGASSSSRVKRPLYALAVNDGGNEAIYVYNTTGDPVPLSVEITTDGPSWDQGAFAELIGGGEYVSLYPEWNGPGELNLEIPARSGMLIYPRDLEEKLPAGSQNISFQ
ncbi:MAG: hypothetical protein JXR86_18225 [Spirochaetales bacterium]|nr:hypothetical protein [Spirochaetales bacterium]